MLGLSPSPIEKIFGVKSLFSGMTEGVYQILNFDIAQAVAANVLSPIIIPLALIYTIRGSVPKIDTKSKELIFFSSLIFLSLIVNFFN
ncbi:DUF2752 domain-containing protein [Gammaproteobacteria bacterium]|nr:DUF2752 domain-containing protein [Gammaproteobacteria bacterium]